MSARPLHVVVLARAVAPLHGYGGLERASLEHARHLARLGARVTVVTQPFAAAALPVDVRPPTVTWITRPYRPPTSQLRRNSIPDRLRHYGAFARGVGLVAAELAGYGDVDIVHAHGLAGAGYAAILAQARTLPPLVLNPHGLEEFSRQHPLKFLAYAPFRHALRRTARAARAVIATDRRISAAITALLGVPAERLITIPNGVDLGQLDALVEPGHVAALRRQLDLGDAKPLLVSVARLEWNKGFDVALAAYARARMPDGTRWAIVGLGSERARLTRYANELGLSGRVRLVGALADRELHTLLQGADLGIVPSRHEGSSLAALEMMARALPVAASATGGLPDKVLPGRTGYLARPGSVADLATTLTAAHRDRANWPRLGQQGRELVEREFNWPKLARRYLDLYRSVAP